MNYFLIYATYQLMKLSKSWRKGFNMAKLGADMLIIDVICNLKNKRERRREGERERERQERRRG